MSAHPLHWRTNLRANLVLYPTASENIRRLLTCVGNQYDEEAFADRIGDANNTRAVRQTLELLSLSGLAYRRNSDSVFALTDYGDSVLSFLGATGTGLASPRNIHLVGRAMARALAPVPEIRTIWSLMHLSGGRLSNEELNRSMSQLSDTSEVVELSDKVLRARQRGDPTTIGKRIYEENRYSDPDRRSEQRKAINPLFCLASGGWVLIERGPDDYRRFRSWAIPVIDRELSHEHPPLEMGTDAESALAMSERAGSVRRFC